MGFSTYSCTDNHQLYTSNNLIDWILIRNFNGPGANTIPVEHVYNKYFKVLREPSGTNGAAYVWFFYMTPYNVVTHNIVFATPPPIGTVITADYKTKSIAKSINNVFDYSATISLGAYEG